MKPRRVMLRYHGGKWKLAPWIISHFGPHRIYTEAFGGAASVLLRKERSYSEVYNDLDGEIVNLFRVLRNPSQARELERVVGLTPFAREEFELSYLVSGDPIEQARRTLFRSFAGFGSGAACGHPTGFRNNASRSGTIPAHDWNSYADLIPAFTERLRGVVIENRPAADVLTTFDGPDTLHYVDPPYPGSTRTRKGHYEGVYRYEMQEDEAHRELAAVLHTLQGAVVLSGYGCALYDEGLYPSWQRVTRATHADGAGKRTEVLWLNRRAASRDTLPLFAHANGDKHHA